MSQETLIYHVDNEYNPNSCCESCGFEGMESQPELICVSCSIKHRKYCQDCAFKHHGCDICRSYICLACAKYCSRCDKRYCKECLFKSSNNRYKSHYKCIKETFLMGTNYKMSSSSIIYKFIHNSYKYDTKLIFKYIFQFICFKYSKYSDCLLNKNEINNLEINEMIILRQNDGSFGEYILIEKQDNKYMFVEENQETEKTNDTNKICIEKHILINQEIIFKPHTLYNLPHYELLEIEENDFISIYPSLSDKALHKQWIIGQICGING
eukprot:250101_1